MKNKLLYSILIIIIIVGAIVYKVKGFNKELNYLSRQQFEISAASTFDESKVKELAKSVITDKIKKINEEYNETISNEDVTIISVPETRVYDIFKLYILPAIITFAIILLYFILLYNKIGIKKVLVKGMLFPILLEIVYYAVIVITRIPLGRVTNCIAVGIYLLTIGTLTICFQNEKEMIIIKEENKKENDE